MTRYAWYRANWPISMQELGSRLQSHPFTADTDEGFVVERIRDHSVSATFYQKVSVTQERVSPFGDTTRVEEIIYHEVEFETSSIAPGLTLKNPPKGSQRFISKISEICRFDVSIGNVAMDVLRIAEMLKNEIDADGFIDTIQIGELKLSGGATAKIVIRGVDDVQNAAEQFVRQSYLVEKIRLRLLGKYTGTAVVLGRGGVARITGRESRDIERMTESCVRQIFRATAS